MKMASRGSKLAGALAGTRSATDWCLQPVFKFDPDTAADPKLSPPVWESTQSRLLVHSVSSQPEPLGVRLLDTVYTTCAGFDVHKATVVVCLRSQDTKGKVRQKTRTFGTTTDALLNLSAGCGLLRSTGCGSTGSQPGPTAGETGAQGDPGTPTADLTRTG